MKINVLTRYDRQGASSRVRMFQYLDYLRANLPGCDIQAEALLDRSYLLRKYSGRHSLYAAASGYLRRATSARMWELADLWWIEKELWPWMPGSR